MITVTEAISNLLFMHNTVVVPGLGAFLKKNVSAKVNPVANYFSAPNCDIEFNAAMREDNEMVAEFLSEWNGQTVGDAHKMVAQFVSDCYNSLKQGDRVELEGVGTLYYDVDRKLVFEQDRTENYNADAFGLCDFTPQPVLSVKSKDEIKAEIEQQQKEKNTPVTVDEEAVHQEEIGGRDKRRGWWIAAAAVAVLLFTLFYFDILHLDFGGNGGEEVVLVKELPHAEVVEEKPVVVEPVITDTFRIIAGIYDREEFAQRIVNSLQSKGFEQAYKMKRGDKWYVAYAWYPTEEEARLVLREIRETGKGKGWILK